MKLENIYQMKIDVIILSNNLKPFFQYQREKLGLESKI